MVDYIYLAKTTTQRQLVPIAYTIKMKRANPQKKICPIEKRYHTNFFRHDIYIFIADTTKLYFNLLIYNN